MSEEIYRGLTEKDIDELISFAIENDIWGFHTGGTNLETDSWIERVYAASYELENEENEEE